MDHHADAAADFITGVISHVSSKHTTPGTSPRPVKAQDVGTDGTEEMKGGLTPRTMEVLNQAMNEQGYIVTDKPEKESEPGTMEEKQETASSIETEEAVSGDTQSGSGTDTNIDEIGPIMSSSESKDSDEGIAALLEAQQSEIEAITKEGIQSPVEKPEQVPAPADVPFDDEDSIDGLELHGPDSSTALPAMSDDLQWESSVYVEDLGTASNPHSPVVMKACPRFPTDPSHNTRETQPYQQPTAAILQHRQQQQEPLAGAGYSPYYLDDGTKNVTEVTASEREAARMIEITKTQQERARTTELAVQAKNQAKERQLKLRADARARRAAEIALRKEVENGRISGFDTRVARGGGGGGAQGESRGEGGPVGAGPEFGIGGQAMRIGGGGGGGGGRSKSPPAHGRDHGHGPSSSHIVSPSSGEKGGLGAKTTGIKKKSPLAEKLAMQLDQIQREREDAGIVAASSGVNKNPTTGSNKQVTVAGTSPKHSGGTHSSSRDPDKGGFKLSKGAIGGLVVDTTQTGINPNVTTPDPFELSPKRPKPPPENGKVADPGPGFYVDSKHAVREKDTGRLRGKGPGGSTPSVPTRDNKPRVGDIMDSPYVDGEYINPEGNGSSGVKNNPTTGSNKKPKYPFSQMRLEKQRAEIERHRLALAVQAQEHESIRQSWEPPDEDYSVKAAVEKERQEKERVRQEEMDRDYDDNVTNKHLDVSAEPYKPAPPREPLHPPVGGVNDSYNGRKANKPGARLPSQRKKAAELASAAANEGGGGGGVGKHDSRAGRDRYVKNLLSPSHAKGGEGEGGGLLYSKDSHLNGIISDIVASRSPGGGGGKYSSRDEDIATIREDGVVDAYNNPQLKAALAASSNNNNASRSIPGKLPGLNLKPDLYDSQGHLIPGSIINPNTGTLERDGVNNKPQRKPQKPLFMRLQEKALQEEAKEEKIRQEKALQYRLRKAEQQPTREEIAEHKRLHDEGILRLRCASPSLSLFIGLSLLLPLYPLMIFI